MMKIENLKVGEICPSPMNPRKTFEKEAIEELAANIKEQGLLQPITVRPCGGSVEKVESTDYGETAYGQFNDMKSKHPDALLLFRCGDFYECYEDDADKAAKVLGITVTIKKVGRKSIKMSGFPIHSLDSYLPKLIRTGTRVAMCDMLFDAKKYKAGPSEVRLNAKGEAEEVKYEIVCGERRFRAVKLLGLETIPAIVREMTDEEAFDAMITENLQRKDVDPIEECLAYNTLLERGQTAEDIAARMGKSVRYVQDRTRLRSLIKKLHKPLKDGLIPLKGAILLAKCSEEVQEKFVEDDLDDEGEQTMSFSDIKDFVDDEFMLLENAPWIGEDGSEPWNTDGVACKDCFKNTANHGCLFYEMKGDAKCTDRTCYGLKKMLYRKSTIRAYGDSVVRKGEDITPGKILLVTETVPSWRGEDWKKNYKDMEKWAQDAGYGLVNVEKLGGRCWYKEDDERTQKMLAEGKVVKALFVWSEYSNELGPIFFYKDKKASEVGERDDKDVLVERYKMMVSKAAESFGEAAVKKLREVGYKSLTDPIDSVEETILLLILLDVAGYSYLNENDIKCEADSRIRFLSEHPEKKDELRRRAIAEFCGRYNQSGVAKMLLHDRYKEAFEELERSNEQSIAKKTAKIVEQLQALGYGVDGSKLE